jgi:hypothetical protein
LIDYFFNYNVASFRRGSSAKIFFKQALKSKELDVKMGGGEVV